MAITQGDYNLLAVQTWNDVQNGQMGVDERRRILETAESMISATAPISSPTGSGLMDTSTPGVPLGEVASTGVGNPQMGLRSPEEIWADTSLSMEQKRAQLLAYFNLYTGKTDSTQEVDEFISRQASNPLPQPDVVPGVVTPAKGGFEPGPSEAVTRQGMYQQQLKDLPEAFQRQFSFLSGQRPIPIAESMRGYFGPSAQAGYEMAPFLRESHYADKPAGVQDMPFSEFLPSLGDTPSPFSINQALMKAGTNTSFLNPAQSQLSRDLLSPLANERVFGLATQPYLAQAGPWMGDLMYRYLQGQMDNWQTWNPEVSFLKALTGGQAPSGFNFLPGF